MAEKFSQYIHDFADFPDLQGSTSEAEGSLDDPTSGQLLNSSLQMSMTPPAASSSQSRSLPSLPQSNFNQLSYPNTAPNVQHQQYFNLNNLFNSTAAVQNTQTLNEHNVPNDFRALIQPQAQALVAESRAENTPGHPTTHNHFHNPGSSSTLMGPGQAVHSGWVASAPSSIPVAQPGGGLGLGLTGHQHEATDIKATSSGNVSSHPTSSELPSIPPASNRPDLPYVLCCLSDCYKIYQGMDAFVTHVRSPPTAPDPGHNLKTSSTSSSTSQPVKCTWQGCREFLKPGSLPKHTEQHALIDWLCAVPGCGLSLATKNHALKHFMDKHHDLGREYPMEWDRVYEIPSKHRRNS